MTTSLRSLTLALTLAAASVLGTSTIAHAQTGTPQSPYVITAAPYTITNPGYYILGKNLNYTGTSGNIIDIQASNVTLDFNGFYIAGPVGNSNQTTNGVHAYERSNLTIKNGTVAYCFEGIYVTGNNSATTNNVDQEIDHMRVTHCYDSGIALYYAPASTVTNCKVSQISGAYGIYAAGAGVTVQGCVVAQIQNGNGGGIRLDAGGFARGNSVSNAGNGILFGKYQDNLTANCSVPFYGGIDAGGNN